MSATHLQLINETSERFGPNVVVFFPPNSDNGAEPIYAWKVIQRLGVYLRHPIRIDQGFTLQLVDPWGNYLPPRTLRQGTRYRIVRQEADLSVQEEALLGLGGIQVLNDLKEGSIGIKIQNDEKTAFGRPSLGPGQLASFQLSSTIQFAWSVADLKPGSVLNPLTLHSFSQVISLSSLSSANVLMQGGGPGPGAQRIRYPLTQIKLRNPATTE
ncbi:MAG: hypothetical protein AAGN35_13690 [Bacteroidota bacterium]